MGIDVGEGGGEWGEVGDRKEMEKLMVGGWTRRSRYRIVSVVCGWAETAWPALNGPKKAGRQLFINGDVNNNTCRNTLGSTNHNKHERSRLREYLDLRAKTNFRSS